MSAAASTAGPGRGGDARQRRQGGDLSTTQECLAGTGLAHQHQLEGSETGGLEAVDAR
jgi:hypothetical protein